MKLQSVADFARRVEEVESQAGYVRPAAFGVGIATCALTSLTDPASDRGEGPVLDTWFPAPNASENFGTAAILASLVGHTSGTASYTLEPGQLDEALDVFAPFADEANSHPNLVALQQLAAALRHREESRSRYAEGGATLADVTPQRVVVSFLGALTDPPVDVHDAYLRLHLLSARKVQPHGLSLEGVFGLLSNVVWTNVGPFSPEGFEQVRAILRGQGVRVQVQSIDKFPRMSDYVVPSGVRLADADRARLGAHLGEGTTVMHEGFVNFNAGTLGASMIEGRISAGVVVDDGSDVGGGASIMGTLSGGGKVVIRLGKNCLLGANSGCGIPLGDGCTIEAGLYVTAGTKVALLPDGRVVKAAELAGQSDLLFRRNSQTGAVEVLHEKNEVVLNEALHKN